MECLEFEPFQGEGAVLQNCPGWHCVPNLIFNGYRDYLGWVMRSDDDFNHDTPNSVDVRHEWSPASIYPVYLHGVVRENFTIFVSSTWAFLFNISY
jgi:hypothetical protein